MIVDHRTYAVKPGSLPAFLKVYQEKAHFIYRDIIEANAWTA